MAMQKYFDGANWVEVGGGGLLGVDGHKYKLRTSERIFVDELQLRNLKPDVFYVDANFIYAATTMAIMKYDKRFNLLQTAPNPWYATNYSEIQYLNGERSFVVIGEFAYGTAGTGGNNQFNVFKFNLTTMTFVETKPITLLAWGGLDTRSYQMKSMAYFNGKLILFASYQQAQQVSGGSCVYEIDPANLTTQVKRVFSTNTTYIPWYVQTLDSNTLGILTAQENHLGNNGPNTRIILLDNSYKIKGEFNVDAGRYTPNNPSKLFKVENMIVRVGANTEMIIFDTNSPPTNKLIVTTPDPLGARVYKVGSDFVIESFETIATVGRLNRKIIPPALTSHRVEYGKILEGFASVRYMFTYDGKDYIYATDSTGAYGFAGILENGYVISGLAREDV